MTDATGTAFAWGLQNSQIGGVMDPQLLQPKWASNRYKNSSGIAMAGIITAIAANLVCWWLTKEQEKQVGKCLMVEMCNGLCSASGARTVERLLDQSAMALSQELYYQTTVRTPYTVQFSSQ
ncbi:hypothetical protein N7490_003526 [Penicillium lividum]|nr:hypothetical protein N7490_003526 [Penicillium lividum]